VPLDYFQDNFLQYLTCCGQEANKTYILMEFWALTKFR
jgi:hypothetical protein